MSKPHLERLRSEYVDRDDPAAGHITRLLDLIDELTAELARVRAQAAEERALLGQMLP